MPSAFWCAGLHQGWTTAGVMARTNADDRQGREQPDDAEQCGAGRQGHEHQRRVDVEVRPYTSGPRMLPWKGS